MSARSRSAIEFTDVRLHEAVAWLLRPARAPTGADVPGEAAAVHVIEEAVRRLDAP